MNKVLKVLIVEDEKAAVDRILRMELWNGPEFTVGGVAPDGKKGLEMFFSVSPDLILTDIAMPVMDGLEFIEQVRREDRYIPIVILSCYESFSYARRAIRLCVADYLLKDFLDEQRLYHVLKGALPVPHRRAPSGQESPGPSRSDLFGRALFGEQGDPLSFHSWCRFRKNDAPFRLLLVGGYRPERESECFTERLMNVGHPETLDWVFLGDEKILILFTGDLWNDRVVEESVVALRNELGNTKEISLVLGNSFAEPEMLPEEYRKVKHLASYRLFFGANCIITPALVEPVADLSPQQIDRRMKNIEELLTQEKYQEAAEKIGRLYRRDLAGMMQYHYVSELNRRLLSLLHRERKRIGLDESAELPVAELEAADTLQEIADWFRAQYTLLSGEAGKIVFPRVGNRKIRLVLDLIRKEYAKELSLERVAERVDIHKVYLSRLFRRETGYTFYDFLQRYRISLAAERLRHSDVKIGDLAAEVGFHHPDQFASVFKKITGVTPSSFRNHPISFR
ncbi:helix-turn-helix domain-containing protein [Sediminispirochaeta bajacaliforniensis]|uniref:helix-turn-helix domain-containing protein n=1 Tax=Sediminispirochaeta bajacaliforniensis TaxID=148 RepID=UPI000366A87D|nr:helix-turn-helix domain-containing protein [Sediminispirochaeta bajacaliforniensis]